MTKRWRPDAEIFLVSVLILYLELVLIRWLGTEIRVFAYLGNLILVVCFFGVGLGCFRAAQSVSWVRLGVNILLLCVLIANPLRWDALDLKRVTPLLNVFEDLSVWGWSETTTRTGVLAGLSIVGVLTYLVLSTFVPVGQALGRAVEQHPRIIRAYSVNVAGSLAGVWLFNGLSWLSTPPALWWAIASLLVIALVIAGPSTPPRNRLHDGRWLVAGLIGLAAVLVWRGSDGGRLTVWSPYHKLTMTPFAPVRAQHRIDQGYLLEVNGVLYQHLLDLSDAFVQGHPEFFDVEQVRRSHYNLPFAFRPSIRRLLIVGAGAGNDAAAACRHGVAQVDCVEIDPQIYALGQQFHPEHPYGSPRVRMVLDDARAFFKQATERYDLIWFGWLDSHTLGSSYNSLRLDHYVYTRESLSDAKRLLADDGLIVLTFGAERRWIADRLFVILRDVFGHDPLALADQQIPREFGGGGNLTLVTGRQPVTPQCVADPALRQYVLQQMIRLPGTTTPTTDDWPYLYLRRPKIPKLHLAISLTLLGTVVLARGRGFGLKAGLDPHFFALGAAFLLLEVQTVSRATLLFGMTWIVNAIVISAVLVMILLANLAAARWPQFPHWLIVTGLGATTVALAVTPLDWFNGLTGLVKLLAASAFLTAPVFFAGLIFIRSLAGCADKARALGANLMGALVGGLLESLAFVTGLRALVGLVGLFYLIALLCPPRRKPA